MCCKNVKLEFYRANRESLYYLSPTSFCFVIILGFFSKMTSSTSVVCDFLLFT